MAKNPRPPAPSATPPPRRLSATWKLAVGLVAVLVTVGVLAYVASGRIQPDPAPGPAAAPADQSGAEAGQPAAPAAPPANARFGPHKQATLPPLPFSQYPPPRPAEIVSEVYKFAAEHPEVLGYVPCYCGCERGGHRGNDDCFVASRAANGDVTSWEPHGIT
jgi:hypothetical protein